MLSAVELSYLVFGKVSDDVCLSSNIFPEMRLCYR